MHLIVGLGNPGKQYESTRHNFGFLLLDYLQKEVESSTFTSESKFKGSISVGEVNKEKVILLKPSTFMNLSGESLRKIVDFYKIETKNIVVIYDDISMEFGKIRTRQEGSAGGHNGIKSIIEYFGNIFTRIKFGVGYDERYEVSDWVLSKFTKDELHELENTYFEKLKIELYNHLKGGE